MMIHHEVVSNLIFFAFGRIEYICQFSSFYKKKIFAWTNGAHVKHSATLEEEFLDSEQLSRGKIQEMLQEYIPLPGSLCKVVCANANNASWCRFEKKESLKVLLKCFTSGLKNSYWCRFLNMCLMIVINHKDRPKLKHHKDFSFSGPKHQSQFFVWKNDLIDSLLGIPFYKDSKYNWKIMKSTERTFLQTTADLYFVTSPVNPLDYLILGCHHM